MFYCPPCALPQLIKNMFDPSEAERESGPGWSDEIGSDVKVPP
jgi:hypothetical protein